MIGGVEFADTVSVGKWWAISRISLIPIIIVGGESVVLYVSSRCVLYPKYINDRLSRLLAFYPNERCAKPSESQPPTSINPHHDVCPPPPTSHPLPQLQSPLGSHLVCPQSPTIPDFQRNTNHLCLNTGSPTASLCTLAARRPGIPPRPSTFCSVVAKRTNRGRGPTYCYSR